jgi:hypothetical protein
VDHELRQHFGTRAFSVADVVTGVLLTVRLRFATFGISTIAACWVSVAGAVPQAKTAKLKASVIVFIVGSFLVWEAGA